MHTARDKQSGKDSYVSLPDNNQHIKKLTHRLKKECREQIAQLSVGQRYLLIEPKLKHFSLNPFMINSLFAKLIIFTNL